MTATTHSVRPMHAADIPAAIEVSALAGEQFREIDDPRIAACADDDPFSAAELRAYVDAGRAWVALDDHVVVGLLVADLVDGRAHVEEVDVIPSAAGRGHGSRLLEAVADWARTEGQHAVTLTTFRDVPWNAPWYVRRGYRALDDHELTPVLRQRRDQEDRNGLPTELRVVMRLDLSRDPPAPLPGQTTLLACWRALCELSPGAELLPRHDTMAAVFPSLEPLNNAILTDDVEASTIERALAELWPTYAAVGVTTWALWVPSSAASFEGPDRVTTVGSLRRDTTTLVMEADLDRRLSPDPGPDPDVMPTSIATLLRVSEDDPLTRQDLDAPDQVDGLSSWVLMSDGVAATTAWTFLGHTDLGIYAVETLPGFRRRGLARRLMEHVMHDGARRGAMTASLQSTAMGRPLYEGLGFRARGRYEEWVHDGSA